MCGIIGIWGENNAANLKHLDSMCKALTHRGPDSNGNWIDQDNNLLFAHTRLAILDTSEAGHQPMISASNRYILTFNGEIYNHLKLRRILETETSIVSWRGSSDTETILTCLELWGFEKTLNSISGMFAFAIWDRESKVLYLARDRMGEKPLYYSNEQGNFSFASELHALRQSPSFNGEIDLESVCDFLSYCHVPDPNTIYKNIFKLKPGHFIKLYNRNSPIEQIPYWSIVETANTAGSTSSDNIPYSTRKENLKNTIRKSVAECMISDVPLGSFLSGGYDSTLITAIMQEHKTTPIETFTIGFNQQEFNEAQYAKKISKYLGTQHHEHYVDNQDIINTVPKVCGIYDEPFSDTSQIPLLLISELAKKKVTVALSGDGGDELFGGYSRYRKANQVWQKINMCPQFARKSMGTLSQSSIDSLLNFFPFLLSEGNKLKLENLSRLANLFSKCTSDGLYQHMSRHWKQPEKIVHNARGRYLYNVENDSPLLSEYQFKDVPQHRWMLMDSLRYLPGTVLAKVDRASMHHSLETRAPFLNPNVIKSAWQLGIGDKVSNTSGKIILKDITHDFVPKELLDRPKQGFGSPIGFWLRNELKDWANNLIVNEVKKQNILDHSLAKKIWDQHQKHLWNWEYYLWDILMLTDWIRQNQSESTS